VLLALKWLGEAVGNHLFTLDVLDLEEAILGLFNDLFVPDIDAPRASSFLGIQYINPGVGAVCEYHDRSLYC
jgi:hypothetical protein